MQRLPLSYLRPGMTLARPALSQTCMVLLAEGSVLTAPLLEWLAGHGMTWACVEGQPVDLLPEIPEAAPRLLELESLFARHGTDAWMCKLKAMFQDHALFRAAMRRLGEAAVKPECDL